MKLIARLPAVLTLIGALFATDIRAEQFVRWQDFEIHYNSFNSMLIPGEVAKSHDITRSKNRIVTNISVKRNGEPVRALVTGTSTNLLSQLITLDFDEVIEQQGIYYLANQLVDEKDALRFKIEIKPEGQDKIYALEYTREYYQ